MNFILILTLILSANTSAEVSRFPYNIDPTQNSKSISFYQSKKLLNKIYLGSNRNFTFYCDCVFNSKKEIDIESCGYFPKKLTNARRLRLEFEHVVPAFQLGKNLQCWQDLICQSGDGKKYKGRRCCSKISNEFKVMEADMHNLFPSVGEINGERSNYRFGEIPYERRSYGECDFEVSNRIVEPQDSIRGDIARSYFYIAEQYRISIPEKYEKLLRDWHLSDPPDDWEKERNRLIGEVQGNRNIFIDFPEMVEKVKDF